MIFSDLVHSLKLPSGIPVLSMHLYRDHCIRVGINNPRSHKRQSQTRQATSIFNQLQKRRFSVQMCFSFMLCDCEDKYNPTFMIIFVRSLNFTVDPI